MPIDPASPIIVTGFNWVPDFAVGHVRDLRARWALEEIGLPYAERLLSAMEPRPAGFYEEQPWGQVPVMTDGDLHIFESGAILIHLGEKDARLLPHGAQARMRVLSWLFAAFNSIEPIMLELGNIDIFARGEEWAKLRRPSLLTFAGQRLDRLVDALGSREYLADDFSIADIAMTTVLRNAGSTDLLTTRPILAAYVARNEARPAFQSALATQLETYAANMPKAK